jgi:uncharacterized protein (TIGR02246 family)
MTESAMDIRDLITRWAAAVHVRNLDVVLADHAGDIVMFDVPPPEDGVRGLDEYRATWPPFFEWQRSGGSFEIIDLEVTAGDDVAFAWALLRCASEPQRREHPEHRLRVSFGLLREGGRWVVAHEHHSFPDRAAVEGSAAAADRANALGRARLSGRLPARDLARARRFYAEALGIEPVEERPGGLRYEGAAGTFSLFESADRPSGEHTQLAFEVDDIEETVRELRERGVQFEDVDVAGLRTIDGIAEVDGNYPSTGASGERAAWFRDSEGNLLGIGQPVRA